MKLNRAKFMQGVLLTIIVLVASYFAVYLAVNYWFNQQYAPNKTSGARAKILVTWRRGGGESETIERLKITAQRLNIDLRPVSTYRNAWYRHFVNDPLTVAVRIFKPDFILALQHDFRYYPGVLNYMTLTFGDQTYIKSKNGEPYLKNPELLDFDVLLPTFANIDALKAIYAKHGKRYFGFNWYPSVYTTNMSPAVPNKLIYSGGHRWDRTRNSSKYAQVFQQLDKTGYFEVTGRPEKWTDTPNSLIGYIPVDGKSMLEAIHKAGVALVLHHTAHFEGNAPTSRIFEAAAANAVIISDRHPFVVQHFGDNVLYIDVDADADIMFKQIDEHMHWIQAHPDEARKMADNCHKINNQNFSLELMLNKLLDMHKQYVTYLETEQVV